MADALLVHTLARCESLLDQTGSTSVSIYQYCMFMILTLFTRFIGTPHSAKTYTGVGNNVCSTSRCSNVLPSYHMRPYKYIHIYIYNIIYVKVSYL